jgi:hypothetical protein
MSGQADSERSMKMARRWFTGGWPGNIALADDILSESARTNGVAVAVTGQKAGYRNGWRASLISR